MAPIPPTIECPRPRATRQTPPPASAIRSGRPNGSKGLRTVEGARAEASRMAFSSSALMTTVGSSPRCIAMKALAITGWNCVPLPFSISLRASSRVSLFRNGLSVVIASNASARIRKWAARGMSSVRTR